MSDAASSWNERRLVAMYLPQFHPIAENNEWWGRGFTEWTNVVKGKPLFAGHYQPHLPADLGFYDLRLSEARVAQAELANAYGITAFCYYHYWFNGRRLLERPLEGVLASGVPDFPFCLCWANENWTRVWDGGDRDILMQQHYSASDDTAHIHALLPVFADARYLRIDGRPIFLTYKASQFPDPRRTTDLWRNEAVKAGIGELFLAKVDRSLADVGDPKNWGFDAAVEFQPSGLTAPWPRHRTKLGVFGSRVGVFPKAFQDFTVYDYADYADHMLNGPPADYLRFPCVTPMWDNSARKRSNGIILSDSTPEKYEHWLTAVLRRFHPPAPESNLVFINAWNEWAEGNHLEPDQRWGHAYLEATKRAIDPR
jgi:lipopolysaccharide biosynthesis protein